MFTEDQSAILAFLEDPATHGAAGPVIRMETHISVVFLVGGRAYKLKRAVDLPYVDFSTPALRLAACEEEVERNSHTAPGLYLGVRRICRRADGRLGFDGDGDMVDAVVEMVEFPQASLFDRMAVEGRLTEDQMIDAASMTAAFHRRAPVVHGESGSANIAGVLAINEAGFATSHVFDAAEVQRLNRAFRDALSGIAGLLDRREAEGHVRRCHGDLHLRNICLLDGKPRLFDCIEFNDKIATVDTLYDLAFLLMDLWHRGLRRYANRAMNHYLDQTGDEGGVTLLPFFMALRAAVRAHVTATQIEEGGKGAPDLAAAARAYFELAAELLRPVAPRLVAIGGLSGSGKTTIAEALASEIGAAPGARIRESDRIRKAMHGVSAETRLPLEAYRPEVSSRVYARLFDDAATIAAAGCTVLVDAVFDRAVDRAEIEARAAAAGVPFHGFWLEADRAILHRRVEDRRQGPSDATVDVLDSQLARDPGPMAWTRIDAALPCDAIVGQCLAAIRSQD